MKKITLIYILFLAFSIQTFAEVQKIFVDIYPNPFTENTTLTYVLENQEHVSVQLYDALGNLIQTIVDENQEKGKFEYKIEVEKIGMYYLQINKNGVVETKRLVKN
jgi:hypothetical protein